MKLLREMFSYGLIGILASGTDALIFTALTYGKFLPHLVANIIGVSVGITISFFLNRHFTFKMSDHTLRRYGCFFAVGLCGLILSEAMLYAGTTWYGFSPMVIKIASIIVVAVFQFVLNKLISFRQFF